MTTPRQMLPHSVHNRAHGQLCCARKNIQQAMSLPTVTPEAKAALTVADKYLQLACEETYNRRLNPDGTIWERSGC